MKAPSNDVNLSREEGEALLERLQATPLTGDNRRVLVKLIPLYFWFTVALRETTISLKRLKRALVGEDKRRPPAPPAGGESAAGEAAGSVAAAGRPTPPAASAATVKDPAGAAPALAVASPERPPGHGRQGADAYTGAAGVICRHETVAAGQPCPACGRGTLRDRAPHYSLVLAKWYREQLATKGIHISLLELGQRLRREVLGGDEESRSAEVGSGDDAPEWLRDCFVRYARLFREGVFECVRPDPDAPQRIGLRLYFSGAIDFRSKQWL